nr:MetaGeneMark_Unknown Function [uncultured bacterium]
MVAGPDQPSGEPIAEESASAQSAAQDIDLAEEELVPEPPPERIEIYRKSLEQPPPAKKPHDDWVRPPEGVALTWAFFSGVFSYAWWPNAIGKWIFLSICLSLAGCVAVWIMTAFEAFWPGAVVLAIVASLVGVFGLSFAAACMVDIIVNTAYNNDKAGDWPDADWRERLIVSVRVGCLLVLSILPAAAIATMLSVTPLGAGQFHPIFALCTFLLFPIILLSSMEADSIWPLSLPTWRSLATAWPGWVVFYATAAALAGGVAMVTAASIAAVESLAPLIFCSVAAAALFSYARLLGRLAWFIRHGEGDDARLNSRYSDRAEQSDE